MPKSAWTEKDQIDNFLKERSETVTHWFTLIVLSALRQFGKENMLKFDETVMQMSRKINTSAGNHVKDILLKLNLPDHRILEDGHGASRFKNQESSRIKDKTSANSDIKDNSSETKLQGRLLESFQEDEKYEHVGQDTRSQDGEDNQDKQGKDLKISKLKTKSKDNDKGSRSMITKHEGTSLQHDKDQRLKNLTTKQSQEVQGSKIQDLTSPSVERVLVLIFIDDQTDDQRCADFAIPLPDVTSKILSKFVKEDYATLFDVIR
ncbi:hypothetical protein Tco_0073663, partial [Tanacetum coccineum]